MFGLFKKKRLKVIEVPTGPKDNPESWRQIHKFVAGFPDDDYWSKWKKTEGNLAQLIAQNQQTGWRTFHSLQFSINRRFKNGLSFGFNDTWSLYDHQSTTPRFEHGPDRMAVLRADQAQGCRLR